MPKKIISLDELSRFKDKLDIELDKKANVDGNYPTMTVGNADNLTPYGENSGASDTTPFVFQSTGGSSDVGVQTYLKELRGNSVAFNQLVSFTAETTTSNGITLTKNNNGSITLSGVATANAYFNLVSPFADVVIGNIYLFKTNISDITGVNFGCDGNTTYWGGLSGHIKTLNANQTYTIAIRVINGTDLSIPVTFFPQVFDLTRLGKIYADVVSFNRDYPKPYYPFNAGTLLSCKVNGIKNVGYNALSLERTLGTLSGSSTNTPRAFEEDKYYVGLTVTNGYVPSNVSQYNVSKESVSITSTSSGYGIGFPIKVIPNQKYTLEYTPTATYRYIVWYDKEGNYISYNDNARSVVAPNNAYWGVVLLRPSANTPTTYTNICFHLTWDSSRTGYEEHKEWQYNLPNIKTRSAGSAYDVLYSIGGGKRRIGVVDLGTLYYTYISNNTRFLCEGLVSLIKKPTSDSVKANIVCAKYKVSTWGAEYSSSGADKCIFVKDSGAFSIRDTAYTDAAAFRTAMSGVYLFYELNEEVEITEEENPGWQNPQEIDDYGTQEFLYDSDIDIPVPQGNDFFYPVDYKAFIDSLGGRNDIQYKANEIVSHTELNNKFVALTQAEYDALTPDANTFYFIKEE